MKQIASRGNVDVYSGLLLVAISVVALLYIRTLAVGTVLQMGPGYFPLGLALILLGMGLCLVVKGFLNGGLPVGKFHLKPLFFVLLSFAAFGFFLDRVGLILAILIQVGISHFASRETDWRVSAVTGLALAGSCAVVFVWLLKVPMSLLP